MERDVECLNNLNQEYLNKINMYKQKLITKKNKYNENINDLKNDLIDEEYVRKELQKLYENIKKDNKILENFIEDFHNTVRKDGNKINMLDKFNDNTENNMNDLNTKLNKLNNNVKKINNYIKNTDDK